MTVEVWLIIFAFYAWYIKWEEIGSPKVEAVVKNPVERADFEAWEKE